MKNVKYYAGIGSRETPYHILKIMSRLSILLEDYDYILRSGGATGADYAFEKNVSSKNIYLPDREFNGKTEDNNQYIYIDQSNQPDFDNAYDSLKLHPIGFKLSQNAKKYMIRNYFQICGHNNLPNSEFVICWTPNASYSGGTAQAMRLANKLNIPIFNLADNKLNSMDIIQLFKYIIGVKNEN